MHMYESEKEIREATDRLAEQIKRDWEEASKRPSPFPRLPLGGGEVCPDCELERAKRACPCCGKRYVPARPWNTMMSCSN